MTDNKEDIKLGDVVYLKSGSPAMTVTEELNEEESEMLCQWFDKSHPESGVFNMFSLTKNKPSVN